jgi:hypothetical protein
MNGFSPIESVDLILDQSSEIGVLDILPFLGGIGAAGLVFSGSSGGSSPSSSGTLNSVTLNAPFQNTDGTLTISGRATAKSTVVVEFPDGAKQTVIADENGNFTVNSTESQKSGEVIATATAPDGSTGAGTIDWQDRIAPGTPSAKLTDNGDGTVTVTGTTEPGSTVTVKYPDGTSDSITADKNGSYTITSSLPKELGEIEVTATDKSGNSSTPSTVNYADETAPDTPSASLTDNGDGTVTVTGEAEPGSTVTVKYPDGTSGATKVADDGSYTITSPTPSVPGEVKVTATDQSGNTSPSTKVDYADKTAPKVPSGTLTDNGDGTVTVTGKAEPDSTVTVKYPDGTSGAT